jgi:hypothetical protein
VLKPIGLQFIGLSPDPQPRKTTEVTVVDAKIHMSRDPCFAANQPDRMQFSDGDTTFRRFGMHTAGNRDKSSARVQ